MALKSKPDKPKRQLLIVDDHPVFRMGLTQIINLENDLAVCGEAADAAEAHERAKTLRPDLTVIDISSDGMGAINMTKSLRSGFPEMRLLMLSGYPESIYAERALRAGANGYVTKRESGSKILSAIRWVLDGKTYVNQELAELFLQRMTKPWETVVDRLSDREFEVFQMIGQGFGTREMAEKLNLSMKTVEVHREHIKQKLKIRGTFDMVRQAIHWVHHESKSLVAAGHR